MKISTEVLQFLKKVIKTVSTTFPKTFFTNIYLYFHQKYWIGYCLYFLQTIVSTVVEEVSFVKIDAEVSNLKIVEESR